jgi:hypothetical protein
VRTKILAAAVLATGLLFVPLTAGAAKQPGPTCTLTNTAEGGSYRVLLTAAPLKAGRNYTVYVYSSNGLGAAVAVEAADASGTLTYSAVSTPNALNNGEVWNSTTGVVGKGQILASCAS